MSMRKYANDYEIVTIEDENGREKETLVYRGKYYQVELDTAGLVRYKRISLLLLAIIIVFHIGGGFVSSGGMYQLYVALPYTLAFFPLIYLTEGILRLPNEKRKFRHDEIGHSFDRMKSSGYFLIALLGVALLGELVFLIFFSKNAQWPMDYLYFSLELVAAVAAFFLVYRQKKIQIQPCTEAEQT
ncbi:MAG: hypothetical protein BGO78_10355 [Chloroflexi bacterium 44-23]|nr:MAG: hypothetical protein BGO78_10355 [Chloroflexi bacterium 44-23]